LAQVTVLDADVLADYLNRAGAWRLVGDHLRARTAATTAIAAFEVWAGLRSERGRAAFGAVLAAMRRRVFPIDALVAREAGAIWSELEDRGARIGPGDCLTAAVCVVRRLPILTANWAHLERIPALQTRIIRAR
jgi:predicted nucleic acid-binding protein